MAKINILDSSIYNRISAGEVVERPSNVVKELVENSIDAGANLITVSIKEGGIKNITVTDNGLGIDKDNIKNAFLPHATSKVSCIDDLDKISTLGFRGEALASIASVAQVTVKSKTPDNDAGTVLYISGGVYGDMSECGMNVGTVMSVDNLFFNTPARAKFLKKPKSEENEIRSVMTEFIVANPDISFKFIADGKTVYQSSGNGLEDALYAVYSKDIVDKLIFMDEVYGNIRVYGYVGSPQLAKPTRAYQTVIVNGRFVNDSTVSAAVANAYGDTMMKRTFPVFIINMVVPFEEVDINVHPSKTEVRFCDQRRIFVAIFNCVRNALQKGKTVFEATFSKIEKATDSKTLIDETAQNAVNKNDGNNTINVTNKPLADTVEITKEFPSIGKPQRNNMNASDSLIKTESKPKVTYDNDISRPMEQKEKESIPRTFEDYIKKDDKAVKTYDISAIFEKSSKLTVKDSYSGAPTAKYSNSQQLKKLETGDLFSQAEKLLIKDYKVIGQIFNAFLAIEYNGELLLMDQHACHERLLYDKLIEEIDNNKVTIQQLLLPFMLKVSPDEDNFIRDNMDRLKAMGFEIEEFRDLEYRIDGVPAILAGIDLNKFFFELFGEKNRFKNIKFSELINDKIAQTACKAAIKAGSELNKEQIDMLIDLFNAQDIPLQCPHGRPAVIKITRKDIDKLFKRIL